MNKVDNFIEIISKIESTESFENIYWGNSNLSNIRKENLRNYLNEMLNFNSELTLLLGEAPGYKGCKLTGIPFTSEYIISTNKFFLNKGYTIINLQKENTSTIIWQELSEKKPPLLWNIFPFHPFSLNKINSNRTPYISELNIGYEIFLELYNIYNINKIITIGRKAEYILKKNNIDCIYLRHPSNGGVSEFKNNFKKLIINKL